MSVEGEHLRISLAAGADLSSGCQFKALAVGGTIAAANTAAVGILQNKPKSGEHATVAYLGHMKAYVGAAATAGARLKVTTSGWLTTVASGDGSCAKAVTAASSGMLCEVIADFVSAATTY